MLLVDDVDNKDFLTDLFNSMYDELPAPKPKKKNNRIWIWGEVKMDFNKMIPELSVFDINKTKKFYSRLGFKIEYERNDERFVFMSFQGSQFMFE